MHVCMHSPWEAATPMLCSYTLSCFVVEEEKILCYHPALTKEKCTGQQNNPYSTHHPYRNHPPFKGKKENLWSPDANWIYQLLSGYRSASVHTVLQQLYSEVTSLWLAPCYRKFLIHLFLPTKHISQRFALHKLWCGRDQWLLWHPWRWRHQPLHCGTKGLLPAP